MFYVCITVCHLNCYKFPIYAFYIISHPIPFCTYRWLWYFSGQLVFLSTNTFFHYWVDKRFYPWNMYMYTFSPKFVTCIHVWLKHLCAWKHIKDHLCVWFLWMCMDSLHMYTKLTLKVICVSDSISVYLNIVRWTSK